MILLRVALLISAACAVCEAGPLRIALVQMPIGTDLAENRERILGGISDASAKGARVVVFPEGALRGGDDAGRDEIERAVAAIREAAAARQVYVLLGGCTPTPKLGKNVNWLRVLDPSGRETLRYDKIYDNHHAPLPGVFAIDGIPSGAIICADRWLRGVEELPIQQGARISFEVSDNFASEWVPALGWYWYVPRALRNNTWVIFANSATHPQRHRHGHSAIIAPDGKVVASAPDDRETIVIADIDPDQATRAEALARRNHPVLRRFWEAKPGAPSSSPFQPLESPAATLTIAAAQVVGLEAVLAGIREARGRGADLVAFPERAIQGGLKRVREAAREHRIHVVVGMAESGHNSAFAIGPDGTVLTRYDQLAATAPFEPGTNPSSMWFRVNEVPAVITIGRDGLWTELAELAGIAGAQVHIHLADDTPSTPLLQTWSNLASYGTFTATVNARGKSALWDDLRIVEETRAEVKEGGNKNTGGVDVFSPFSANLIVRAGPDPEIILARRTVNRRNPYHVRRIANINPDMLWWYEQGVALIRQGNSKP